MKEYWLTSILLLALFSCDTANNDIDSLENQQPIQIIVAYDAELFYRRQFKDTLGYLQCYSYYSDQPDYILDSFEVKAISSDPDTVRHGWYRSFYPSGQVKQIAFYWNGKLDGINKYISESGLLTHAEEFFYVDGVEILNKWWEFDSLGNLIAEKSFDYNVAGPSANSTNGDSNAIVVKFADVNYKEGLSIFLSKNDSFDFKDKSGFVRYDIDSNYAVIEGVPTYLNEYGNFQVLGYIQYDERKLFFDTNREY